MISKQCCICSASVSLFASTRTLRDQGLALHSTITCCQFLKPHGGVSNLSSGERDTFRQDLFTVCGGELPFSSGLLCTALPEVLSAEGPQKSHNWTQISENHDDILMYSDEEVFYINSFNFIMNIYTRNIHEYCVCVYFRTYSEITYIYIIYL